MGLSFECSDSEGLLPRLSAKNSPLESALPLESYSSGAKLEDLPRDDGRSNLTSSGTEENH